MSKKSRLDWPKYLSESPLGMRLSDFFTNLEQQLNRMSSIPDIQTVDSDAIIIDEAKALPEPKESNNKRRIKVVYDGEGPAYRAEIVDAKTGEEINYVTRVEVLLDIEQSPQAVLHTVLPVIDVVIDAEIRTHCPLCNQEVKEQQQQ